MRRREFITILGAAAVWPLAAHGQRAAGIRRLGVLMVQPEDDAGGRAELASFAQGLAEFGWIEGRNLHIDVRWRGGDAERTGSLAKELVLLNPDLLISRSTPITAALKRETGTIPIVFVNVAEPVASGFVETLARPGGNITGLTNFEASIGGKWLQLFKQLDPGIRRVAVVYNPQTAPFAQAFLDSVHAAAPTIGVDTAALPIPDEAEMAFVHAGFARQSGGGVIVIPDSFTLARYDQIISICALYRLPAMYSNLVSTPAGALISYAVDTRNLFQRASSYVDRILRGARVSELPVEQPTKFRLSINLKTTKALGLEISAILVDSADEVIE
jgi:putative ABC transport system substrate-binding protein